MLKTLALVSALTFGLATSGRAAITATTTPTVSGSIVKVGEGCGANRWRDRNGVCHWFGGPGGVDRGTAYECPPGMHIGQGGQRCWPNQ